MGVGVSIDVMTREQIVSALEAFCERHGVDLEERGSIGFGRPAVGFTKGDGYLEYSPINMTTFDPLPGFPEDERLWAPDEVDGYHKHNCIAVLANPDKISIDEPEAEASEAEWTRALRGLLRWVRHLQAQGELEVVEFHNGRTGMGALAFGTRGYAIRFKEDGGPPR